MAGHQVRLFLVDGTPGGLMTAEIINWTGHVLKGKRDRLTAIRDRPEAKRTGIYLLFGEDNSVGGRMAYIQTGKVDRARSVGEWQRTIGRCRPPRGRRL